MSAPAIDPYEHIARAVHEYLVDSGEDWPPFDDLCEWTICHVAASAAYEVVLNEKGKNRVRTD